MATITEGIRASGRLPRLEWAAAGRPLPGEIVSGDLHLVCPFPGGALLGVVDGLGHGQEAAFAAKVAAATLERYSNDPLWPLLRRCHEMLKLTRGVAACLASVDWDSSKLTWVAVGNVEGVILRADPGSKREAVLQYGGVVGYHLPKLSGVSTLPLGARDCVILATDGVKDGFAETVVRGDPPGVTADRILERHAKGTDDALVLVAAYAGPEG